MDCVRSITFIIPGIDGLPDVEVTAVEADGSIEFSVEVLPTADGVIADLRGLFFNVNDDLKLAGLTPAGGDVTDFDTGGYAFRPELSEGDRWVFLRDAVAADKAA